jgi:chromosome segregation ATPase
MSTFEEHEIMPLEPKPYTVRLADGKYEIENANGVLTFRRNGEPWPVADDEFRGAGVVLALVQRVEELETGTSLLEDPAHREAQLSAALYRQQAENAALKQRAEELERNLNLLRAERDGWWKDCLAADKRANDAEAKISAHLKQSHEENETLRGLVQANAEHAAQLLEEKAALQARIRELERKPPTYEDWRRAAYDESIDRTSRDLKQHVESLDVMIAQQRKDLDRAYQKILTLDLRRQRHFRNANANRARAKRLDKLYRLHRAKTEFYEKQVKDRFAFVDSEKTVLLERVRSERNNALEEALVLIRRYGVEVAKTAKTCSGSCEGICTDLAMVIEDLKGNCVRCGSDGHATHRHSKSHDGGGK